MKNFYKIAKPTPKSWFCYLFYDHMMQSCGSEGIVIEDKSTLEQIELIQQLDDDDKSTVFKIIDKMLTTKKFKDFLNKNVAAL